MAPFYYGGYTETMLKKILIGNAVLSGGALAILIATTTPATAGAFGVLCIFLLAYLLLVSFGTFSLYWLSRCVAHIMKLVSSVRPVEKMSLKHAYYYATILAIAPVVMVSMASVGTVGLYDVGLILVLEFLGCLYVTKRLPS